MAAPFRTLILLAACAGALHAQSLPPLSYDISSVKINKSDSGNMSINYHPDGWIASNVGLHNLIQNAWELKTDSQLIGLPAAIASVNFDVEGKMDPETVAELKKLSPKDAGAERSLMLQKLLEDRFQLKVHHETRELPMYALVAAKTGAKIKQADPAAPHSNTMYFGPGKFTGNAIPLSSFAFSLGGTLNRQVVDKTGLTGNYNIELKWSPEGAPLDAESGAGPSLFTALEEQLGLRLEPIKGPVDVVVVDHVEMPSQN